MASEPATKRTGLAEPTFVIESTLVARDGIWPAVWTWRAVIRVYTPSEYGQTSHTEHLRGNAISKVRAQKKMKRALSDLDIQAAI
jgi:hypothetical protein